MKYLLSALILLTTAQASFAYEIICYGQQPSWSASIGEDNLLLTSGDLDYRMTTQSTVNFVPEYDTNADHFRAQGENISMAAFRVGVCGTDSNNVVYSHKVKVNLNGQTLEGCCRVAH